MKSVRTDMFDKRALKMAREIGEKSKVRQCEMCGAHEGKPHHDPSRGFKGKTVTLHRTKHADWAKLICMVCRAGMYAIRRELKRKETK